MHCIVAVVGEVHAMCSANTYIVKQLYGEIKAKWHTISLFIILVLVTTNIWVRPMAITVALFCRDCKFLI